MNEKTSLSLFNFDGASLRVSMRDGEPWFVAGDVCRALDIGNVSQALTRLDDDERGVISNDTPNGVTEIAVVSESGLYSLVLGSRKPEARAFKRWVTREVIPTIRKTGSYAMTEAPAALNLRDPMTAVALLADALTVLKEERDAKEAAQASLAIAETKIAADAPKVTIHDRLIELDGTSGFREAAQAVRAATGANENVFRGLMRKHGWIQRLDGRLAPMVKGMAHGFVTRRMTAHMRADGSEHTVVDLRITPKGIAKAIELLLVEMEVEP